MNPIEQAFAQLKALLRSAASRTGATLWQAIGHALDSFTPAECAHYLAHAGYVPPDRENALVGQAGEVAGIGFAGAKGFAGGFGARMLSPFGEPAIKQFVTKGVEEAVRLEPALRARDVGSPISGDAVPGRHSQTLQGLTITAPRQVTR